MSPYFSRSPHRKGGVQVWEASDTVVTSGPFLVLLPTTPRGFRRWTTQQQLRTQLRRPWLTCARQGRDDSTPRCDAFPPLAGSDYLNGDKFRAIKTVTGGLETKLTVNGREFNGVMPAWSLSDEDIADVLTYVYNTWGNSGQEVTPAEVEAYRIKAK